VGTRGYYQVKASWSQPLRTDELAARLSFTRTSQDGFVSNPTSGRKLNGSDRIAGRAQLLWIPSETLSVRVIGDYGEEHSEAGAFVLSSPGPDGGAKYYSAVAAAGAKVIYDRDYDAVTIDGRQHFDVRSSGASAELNWDVGGHRLTAISAHRRWWFMPHSDGDYTDRDAITAVGQQVDDSQWTQELRLASPSERAVSYVLGLYYFNQHQANTLYTQYGLDAQAITALQLGNATFAGGRVETRQLLGTDSRAAFAQGTWRITPATEFAFGLRATREQKHVRVARTASGSPAFRANPTFNDYESDLLERRDSAVSALLSGSYRLSPHLFAYASLARGEKSGGINPSAPAPGLDVSSLYVGPERVKDAEAGMKATLLDRRLTVDTNVFWMHVRDYQATLLLQPGTGDSFQQILSNIGAVRSRGIEIEISGSPNPTVKLRLAASYNDSSYLSYPNAPCSAEELAPNLLPGQKVCDLRSQPVVGAPRWILNPGLTFSHSAFGNLDGEVDAAYSWRSSYFGSADNSQLARVPSYGITNLRYSLHGKRGARPFSVTLWAQNLFNERYTLGGLVVAGRLYNYIATPGLPRTAGITVRAEF
jgi:iron complex outermembrane receptor protein